MHSIVRSICDDAAVEGRLLVCNPRGLLGLCSDHEGLFSEERGPVARRAVLTLPIVLLLQKSAHEIFRRLDLDLERKIQENTLFPDDRASRFQHRVFPDRDHRLLDAGAVDLVGVSLDELLALAVLADDRRFFPDILEETLARSELLSGLVLRELAGPDSLLL